MKNKIVLFSSDLQYAGVPMALLAVTKLLDKKENDIKIITSAEYPKYKEEILAQCEGALCFGISCISGTPIKSAIEVSKMVKEKYPSLPIIWGGWQAITLPDVTLQEPYVDYLCTGQGERTFSEFIRMLRENDFGSIDKIDGLSYKNNGVITHNNRRVPEDLNSFPDFDLDLIEWDKYLEVTDFGNNVLRIVTSYGCPYRCGFCCEPNNSKRQWKSLTAERIISLLKKIRSKVDFDGLMIVENNFFVREQRVIDFCNGLIENGFNIKLGQVNGRTNKLVTYKESTWGLLKQAGLHDILIGAESANEETLRLINKDATVEQTYLLSRICRKYEIKLIASIIVGLPIPAYFSENSQDAFDVEFREITKLYKDLFLLDRNNRLIIFIYAPLPFSPMYERAIELGFRPPKNLEEWGNYDLTETHIGWISKKNIVKVQALVYVSSMLAIDFKYLVQKLPIILRVFVIPMLGIANWVSKLRLRYDCYSFPLDSYMFYAALKLFKRLNKTYKFINITN
ncbi:MAG: radical SAM protein [PVC group bacterium]|nr:radical SAM protein [PVC group bacterium]